MRFTRAISVHVTTPYYQSVRLWRQYINRILLKPLRNKPGYMLWIVRWLEFQNDRASTWLDPSHFLYRYQLLLPNKAITEDRSPTSSYPTDIIIPEILTYRARSRPSFTNDTWYLLLPLRWCVLDVRSTHYMTNAKSSHAYSLNKTNAWRSYDHFVAESIIETHQAQSGRNDASKHVIQSHTSKHLHVLNTFRDISIPLVPPGHASPKLSHKPIVGKHIACRLFLVFNFFQIQRWM